MKKLLLLFPTCLLALGAFAQKVDLDPFNFTFEYTALPSAPLDTAYSTYSVMVDAPGTVSNAMSPQMIGSQVILHGYKLSTDRQGHVNITLSFDDLIFTKVDIKDILEETKNKEGKVTSSKRYYWVEAEYTFAARYRVSKYTGEELMNRRASFSNSRMTYSSSRYESYDQANSYFRNNRSALSNNLVKEKLNTALYEANADINNNFGFRPLTENTFLWLLDSKKHPEYETMQAKWVTLKPILKSVQAGSMSEAQRSAISDMITYLEGVKKTYIKDEKGDRKMRYAAYYNSAKLYLFLDEPEKAIEQAELLILNEYDEKDGKHLKEQAERMIELFTKNNIRTRHFVIDLSDAKAPG